MESKKSITGLIELFNDIFDEYSFEFSSGVFSIIIYASLVISSKYFNYCNPLSFNEFCIAKLSKL